MMSERYALLDTAMTAISNGVCYGSVIGVIPS